MAIQIPYPDGPQGPTGYNRYASGKKQYGYGGRPAPNIGAVQNTSGYAARERRAKARKDAMRAQMRLS